MVRALFAHSYAWIIIGAVGGLEVVALVSRRAPWLGEWVWTIDWMGGMIPLVAAAAAGVAAVAARAFTSRARADLLATTPHRGRALLGPVVTCIAVAVAAHLVGVGVAVALTAVANPTGGVPVLPVLEQVTAIVAAGLTGALLGARVRSPVSPVVAAGGTVMVALYADNLGWYPLLDTGGATGSLIGLHYNYPSVAVRIGLLVLTSLTLVGLLVAGGRRLSPLRVASILGLSGVITYMLFVGGTDETRFVVDNAPMEYKCAAIRETEVCVHIAHQRFLDDVAEPISHAVATLKDLGVHVDRRWEERLLGHEPVESTGYFRIPLEAFEGADVDDLRLVSDVVQPRPCFTAEPPSVEQDSVMMILVAEAATRANLVREGEWIGDVDLLTAFGAAEPEDQEAWLKERYGNVQQCNVQELTLPQWVPEDAIWR